MSEPVFDEQHVRDAYAWVWRCLEAYEEYMRLREQLQFEHPDPKGPFGVWPSRKLMGQLAECVSEFRVAAAGAKSLIDDLVWHAPAVATEAPVYGVTKGSSWAEVVIRHVLKLAEAGKGWETFEEQSEKLQQYMINVLVHDPNDPQLLDSRVKIEAARLRDRALSLSAYEKYGYVLTKLTPQSRRFLQLLVDHQGGIVPYDRVEKHLWPADSKAGENLGRRRTSAMHALRAELKAEGFTELRAES